MVRAVPGVPHAARRPDRPAARADGGRSRDSASRSTARPRPSTTTSRSGPRPSRSSGSSSPRAAWRSGRGRSCSTSSSCRARRSSGTSRWAGNVPRRSAGRCASATCPTCSVTSPRCRRSCAAPGSTEPSSGAASPRSIDRHHFPWRAPDGSTVDTEYLVGGYGNGAYLFDVPDRLGVKLGEYRRTNARHVRRPLAPRDVRDRPRRPLAEARRPRRARQRRAAATSRSGWRP